MTSKNLVGNRDPRTGQDQNWQNFQISDCIPKNGEIFEFRNKILVTIDAYALLPLIICKIMTGKNSVVILNLETWKHDYWLGNITINLETPILIWKQIKFFTVDKMMTWSL